jgi:hypothetical protein
MPYRVCLGRCESSICVFEKTRSRLRVVCEAVDDSPCLLFGQFNRVAVVLPCLSSSNRANSSSEVWCYRRFEYVVYFAYSSPFLQVLRRDKSRLPCDTAHSDGMRPSSNEEVDTVRPAQ